MNNKEFIRQMSIFYELNDGFPNCWLPCGSTFELPLYCMLSNQTDIDYLFADSNICAIAQSDIEPSTFNGTLLWIDTSGCHVGYAKLRIKEDQHKYFFMPKLPFRHESHGPACRPSGGLKAPETNTALKMLFPLWTQSERLPVDMVYAVYCPTWPKEATEWKTRTRDNSWPSENLLQQIVNGGCHLVAKPFQGNPVDEAEWRFSFSKAEIVLILSWTDNQKYIYHILRLIKAEVSKECGGEEKTALCSYFFKTLMFWAIENKSSDFWDEKCTESSILTLVCEMIECLIERKCPNYFIRGNNMMGHLLDEVQINRETIALVQIAEHRISAIMTAFPKTIGQFSYPVLVPSKLTLLHSYNFIDKLLNPQNTNLSKELPLLLIGNSSTANALRNLYKALEIHKNLSSQGFDCECEQSELSRALKYFQLASETKDKYFSYVNLSLSDSYFEFFSKAIASLKCSLMSDTDFELAGKHSLSVPNGMSVRESLHTTTKKNDQNRNMEMTSQYYSNPLQNDTNRKKFCEDIAKRIASPKENCFQLSKATKNDILPSTFASIAYTANFYYSHVRKYHLAISQYDNVVSYIDCDLLNFQSFTRPVQYFPVIITNEWSSLFDEHIQTVLGFITLCKATGPTLKKFKTNHVVIYLSPVRLLKYIKFQCRTIISGSIDDHALHECLKDFSGRTLRGLRCYEQFSRFIISAALRANGVKTLSQ